MDENLFTQPKEENKMYFLKFNFLTISHKCIQPWLLVEIWDKITNVALKKYDKTIMYLCC